MPGGIANFTTLPAVTSPASPPLSVFAGLAPSHGTSTIAGLPGVAGAAEPAAGAADPAGTGGGAAAPGATGAAVVPVAAEFGWPVLLPPAAAPLSGWITVGT